MVSHVCGRVARAATDATGTCSPSDADPIQPARIYGELLPPARRDAVVIGDGGDFVSYAGQVRRPLRAGRIAGPRAVRLPGHGPGLRDRRRAWPGPTRQVVLLLGDGAAGFSLEDVDTLVRHGSRWSW